VCVRAYACARFSNFRAIMRCALPNTIKIRPRNGGQPTGFLDELKLKLSKVGQEAARF
jgi:hypothetical protein